MNYFLILILCYFLFILVLYFKQRSFIYLPDRNVPYPASYGMADMNVISVTADDGLVLKAWYKAPLDSMPVVLMFHGNAGNIGIRAFKGRSLIDAGYGFLLAEYRGYGGNPGKPSEEGFYRDARAYMVWLKQQQIPESLIVIYGESIGTGSAVQMAVEHPGIRGLILEAPFTNLPALAQRHAFYALARYLIKDNYDNLGKVGAINVPMLVLHGKADLIVPYEMGKRLFEAANEPKKMEIFPIGGHNDLYMHGAALRILKFLTGLD